MRLSLHGHVHANTLATQHGIAFASGASAGEFPMQWREVHVLPCEVRLRAHELAPLFGAAQFVAISDFLPPELVDALVADVSSLRARVRKMAARFAQKKTMARSRRVGGR